MKERKSLRLLLAGSIFLGACASAGAPPAPPHHTPNGFRNLYEQEEHGYFDFFKWRWQRLWRTTPVAADFEFPLAANDPGFLGRNRTHDTLTWIGHATALLQIAGVNILTDPQFSERASPLSWLGPRRAVQPGLSLEQLPAIDCVLLSHNHYDSLDAASVVALRQRPGGAGTRFFVPLGLKAWFERLGITNVVELDWGNRVMYKGLEIVAVPAQHWSKRTVFRQNRTLWAGWVVLGSDFRVYFAGDSGYAPHFDGIGSRYGPFDLSLIPIGAYEPRWFMRLHHLNPAEAVRVHRDVRSKLSVAIHWGTFPLTDEPLDEPPGALRRALREDGVPEDAFRILQHGQTIALDAPRRSALATGRTPARVRTIYYEAIRDFSAHGNANVVSGGLRTTGALDGPPANEEIR